MPKRSYFRGVIDPITIIGVLFLIITLIVGTYVARDRNFSLNINEKAAIIECFPAGTKIATTDGVKNIEEFSVGDKVLSENEDGVKEISNTQKLWKLWSFNMCSIDFESGEKLKLTNPHPLYTQEGWKAINVKSALEHNPELTITELKESDSVKKQNGTWDKITSISCEYGLFRVYNLAVDNNNNYYAEGFLAHNKTGGPGVIPVPGQTIIYDEEEDEIIDSYDTDTGIDTPIYNPDLGNTIVNYTPQPVVIIPPTPEASGCNINGNIVPENITVVFSSGANDYRKCVAGSWITDCNQSQSGVQACTLSDVSSGAVPAYLLAQYNQEIQRLSDECTAGGGVWLGNQCGTIEQSVQVYDIDPRFKEDATNLVTQIKDASGNTVYEVAEAVAVRQTLLQGRGQQALYTTIKDRDGNVISRDMAILQYQNLLNVEKTDDGFIRNFTTIVRDQNTKQILNALTQSINTKDLAQVTEPSQSYYFADCSREGLTPEQTAECNRKLTQAYNAPIIGRYLQAYAPQEVQYTGDQFLGYNLYNPTKEQLTSSVALGSAMTAGAAVITAGGGLAAGGYTLLTAGGSQALLAAGATTITQSIALGMAGMSTYQLGTTTDTCITEGYTDNCRTQIAWTALSYANIGSSALQGAYQTSRVISGANTFINVVNVATDIADISQSCGDGEYASGFGCGAAIVGTIFDVGQGVSDFGLIEAIAKNINFSNIANNPLAQVDFQSPNQLQLGAPDVNIPKGIDPNNVIDVVQSPNGNSVVPNTSTTALTVAPHLDIAQTDDAITATILNDIPATRPNAEQEIAGYLTAPGQPINVTYEFAGLTPKVEVDSNNAPTSFWTVARESAQEVFNGLLNPRERGSLSISSPFRNADNSPTIDAVVKRVDEALTRSGEPNGIGCRNTLCETSAGFVKADAEINGLDANNYDLVQVLNKMGVPTENMSLSRNNHIITVVVDKNGKKYLSDLTIGQFDDIDLNSPIAKQLLKDGYFEMTDSNLNEYLKLFIKIDFEKISVNIFDSINSHPILSADMLDQYFSGKAIDLRKIEPLEASSVKTVNDILSATEILIKKGYTYDQIDEMFFFDQINASPPEYSTIARNAPDLKVNTTTPLAQRFGDWVKNWWDEKFGGIGGFGSPAVDPVADSNTFDDLIKQAEDSISPEYDEAMKHYQDNSPYQPGSASIAPINELETNIMLDIKKTDSNSPMPLRELIVNDRIRSNLVDSIIQTDNLDEAIRILEANNVKVHLVPRSEISGASGWAKDTKNMYIADDVATNWSTAKGTVAHESTHIVMGHEKDIAFIKYTENHRNLAVSEALKKVGEEDWAFANGIRADLYELKNNKNLTPDQITTIQQHIKHSIENYNWVVFGDVLPNRNILSPDIQPVDNGLNIPNTRALGASKFIANADDPGIPYQIKNQVTREINSLEDLEQFFESDNSPRPINLEVSLANAIFSEPRVEFVPLDLVVGGTEGGKYNDTFLVYPKGQEAETRGREYVLQIAKDYASGRPLDPYAPQEYYKYQGKYYVVDGRHSTAALKALGVTEIPAVVRDIESLNGSVIVTGNIRIPSNSNTPPAGVWGGVKNWLVELDVIAIIDDIPWIPNSVKIALRGTRLVGNNGLDIPNFRTQGDEIPPYGMTQQELKELEEWASDTSNGPAVKKPEVNENGVIQYPEPVLPIPKLAPRPGTKEYDDMVSAALAREKARGSKTIITGGPSDTPFTIIKGVTAATPIKQRVLLRIAEDVAQTMAPSSTTLPASAINGQVKVQTPNGTKIDPTVDAAFTVKESNLSSVTLTANQPIRIGWRRIKPDVEFTINTNGIIVISPNISMKWSGIKDQFEIIVKENPGFWSKILGLKKVTQIVKLDNQRPSFFYPGDQIVSTSQLKQFPGITTKTIPPRIIAGKQVFYSVTIDRKVSYYPLGEINVLPQSKTNYFVEFGALTEADGKTNWIQLGDLVVDGDTESNYIRLKNTNLNYVTSMIVNNFSNTEIIHQYPNIFESLGQSVLNRLINVGSNNPLRMYLYSPENSFFPVFKGFVEKIDVKNWFGSGSHATDPVAGSDRIINTNVYNGSDLQIIYRSETDQLTPDNLDEIIAQAEAGGIRINREGDFISAGFDRDGTYSLTLPPDSDPLSKLHELIHLDQDLKALQAGISISQLENLPPYNRALYEIQASTETLKYMEKWQIDDDIARIQEEINIEESTKVLNELGEEVPEKITEPWKSIPSNKNVEHLSAFTAPLSPSGFWGGVKNWWEGLKQNDNIIVKFFANLNEKGSLGVPNPFYRNQFVIPLGANHQTELFSHLDTISGNHGEITIQGDTIYYQDTRSTNGSYFRNSPDEQFVKMKRDQIIEVLPNTEIRMADTSPFKVEVQDDGSVVIHNTVKNNLSAKVYEPRITTNSRSIGVNQFLGNKNDRLPTGISWNYDDRSIHQIPTSRISSINTVLLQDVGGGGKSVDDFRKMIRDRTFDTESHLYLNDPVVGYELPDGTIYIESGRHKAQAMIEEGFSEIPMRLYTIKDQKNSGQTLIEFGTILPAVIAVPTTVLYYFDEYFDLGITDSVLNSINESLEDGSKPMSITDPAYNAINFWLNSAAIVYGLNSDKELSEIAISNPNQRPYDEIIQEAIDNYTENNPDSDVYYESNPQAMSLAEFFSNIFSKNSLDMIYLIFTKEEYKELTLSQKLKEIPKKFISNNNPVIDSVLISSVDTKLFTKQGGENTIEGFDEEMRELITKIEQESIENGGAVSHSFVIEHFLEKNNGDLTQSLFDASNFEEYILRGWGQEMVDDPYLWIQNNILDEYSPLLPYQTLPLEQDKLENSEIYYDYSLQNRLGEVYHAANITALLNYIPPEVIRFMVIGEYVFYGNKHGLIKLSADLEVLKQLDDINNLLESYEQPSK